MDFDIEAYHEFCRKCDSLRLTKKAPSVFSRSCFRSRARAYRSHRKTAAASNSSGDDDGGSDSDPDPDPPAKPRTLLSPPKEQMDSFSLAVAVSPRQMLHGLIREAAA